MDMMPDAVKINQVKWFLLYISDN